MARRISRSLGTSNLEEYLTKKLDAEQRLAGQFALFVKSNQGGLFISGGSQPAIAFSGATFEGVLIGASLKESEEALSVLREAASVIRSVFSENDFYAKISTDFLSDYLREVLEDLKVPVAIASEFIVLDFMSSNLIRVFLSGDYRVDDLSESNEKYFFIGLYNKKTENLIRRELDKQNISELLSKKLSRSTTEKLKNIAKVLKEKLGSGYINLVS